MLTDFCCGVPVSHVSVKVVLRLTVTLSPLKLKSVCRDAPLISFKVLAGVDESTQAVSPGLLLQVMVTLPPRRTRLGETLRLNPVWALMHPVPLAGQYSLAVQVWLTI